MQVAGVAPCKVQVLGCVRCRNSVGYKYGRMYQGGEAVSKTACGGFDSQPSVPGQGEETDDSRRFICE